MWNGAKNRDEQSPGGRYGLRSNRSLGIDSLLPRTSELMNEARVALITACVFGLLGSEACGEVNDRSGSCYHAEHCPEGQICNDQGLCEEPPSPLEEEVRLDVGTNEEPEIPATCEEALRVRTHAGCEFLAVDLPNAWEPSGPYVYDIAADQQFAVVVANASERELATVRAYVAGSTEPAIEVEVSPLRTRTLNLPARSVDPTRNSGGDAYRIESDVPITAYQFQPLDNLVPVYSNDASALLPTHVLESDYMAMTAHSSGITLYPDGFEEVTFNAGAFVTAVAAENDTTVRFYPTAVLAAGGWSEVRLGRGQQFTILADYWENDPGSLDPTGNLSGTRVIADKPIAVFSGNVTATEPIDGDGCCADHVEHQMPPLVAWGYRYVAGPPPDPTNVAADDPAVYRVLAAFDDTRLSYPSGRPEGAPESLGAGEVGTFQTADPLAVVSDPEHPIAVGQFLLSAEEANANGVLGDPAFVALPSVEQLQRRYVFLAPNGYATHAAGVVVPEGSRVEIDGEALSGGTTVGVVDGMKYVHVHHEIEPGAHVLTSDEPAALIVYGYDDYVSYAYTGGTAIRRISDVPPAP